ncbi:unnamed protein product [Merluccius merluccius]
MRTRLVTSLLKHSKTSMRRLWPVVPYLSWSVAACLSWAVVVYLSCPVVAFLSWSVVAYLFRFPLPY